MWNEPTKEELDKLPRLYETEESAVGREDDLSPFFHRKL